MRCIGFGEKENKCRNGVDKKTSVAWCSDCEKLRRETITKQMYVMLDYFDKQEKEEKS